MYDSYTPGAQRALDRAQVRARMRGGFSVEPVDLLAALADDIESRAADLMNCFGLQPERVLSALGVKSEQSSPDPGSGTQVLEPDKPAEFDISLPHSATLRVVLLDAMSQANATDPGRQVGTEHLLAGLMAESCSATSSLHSAGLKLDDLRSHLAAQLSAHAAPLPTLEGVSPLDLHDPARAVDLGRILDASANRSREGLRVVEDYARFVLDDPGLTRRLKEVRHRLAEALRGFDPDLLIAARDTREDVGTHIMTESEQVRENPRAVLSANFKRIAEALRTLEEYAKLVDVWLSGRFEVLRYDIYTLEKITLTSVQAYRALGEAKLMVLVGGLPTLGDLTWIVGEALAGGADVIELREKNLADRDLLARAREVRILTDQSKARFILNDRPDLARLAGADGVHLGQDDLSIRDARRIVGPHLLIGVSTHNLDQLSTAILSGAGYLGVGPVFPSITKEFSEPELAGLAFVEQAALATNLPWFAIGGITEENVEGVLAAGATRIAVSGAVVQAKRPRRATARLKSRLEGREPDDHEDLEDHEAD
jgi:thiamine-phosphate pyrophosphorylase